MQELKAAGYECIVKMGCYIDDNRNFLVTNDCQKIKQTIPDSLSIFIDSDMDFDIEDVRALEDAAHSYPIIGVPYRTQKDNGRDCCGNVIGSKSGIVEVPYIGTGFLAILSCVFNHLEYPYFTRPLIKKNGCAAFMGEDLSFCKKVREAGFKIYAHYGINIHHNLRKEQLLQPNNATPQPPPDLDKIILAIQDFLSAANRAYKTIYAQGTKDQAALKDLQNDKEKKIPKDKVNK